MIVGVLKLSLILAENHSLKGKRGALRRIQARVSHKFNISVTEFDDQDLWQSAVLGFGMVGSSRQIVEGTLHKVVGFVEDLGLAQVGDAEVELFYC
ncbi:MAG: DUF503 domain-containing protein [Deltaproteobacteria bacterium]|nr:DUF503 domain-containing protein [Deltaproteobacteria bacterium]